MRQRIGTGIVLVVLVAIVLLGVWLLGTSVIASLGLLPSATRVAVIGLIGIVIVPVIAYFTTKSQERRRARDDAIREKRTEFYDKAIRGMLRMFNLDKSREPLTPEEQVKFFADITPEFLLYASRGVVLAWGNFRNFGQQPTPNQKEFVRAFEDVFREMRKDLGHEVPPRPNLELMALFINDIDTLKPERQSRLRRKPPTQAESAEVDEPSS